MTTVLLDQVAAYADQVRAHLADLGAEAVDELTDGLEADLAEELAERSATVGAVPGDETVLDLARVFGPASVYAAELRSAAGLAPAGPAVRRRPVRDALRKNAESWSEDAHHLLDAIRGLPGGRWAVETTVALRPLWWVARGWVWFVAVGGFYRLRYPWSIRQFYVPETGAAWLLLLALVLVSVAWGRGGLTRPRALRLGLGFAHAAAVVAVLPLVVSASALVADARVGQPYPVEVLVEVPAEPDDGVIVDGMYVSNLFVYDAQGNPLQDVQIVDDRGRPVRTVTDGSASDWQLPGVDEAWAFAPSADESGRARWNVYPLAGAPSDAWQWLDDEGTRELVPGESPRLPPAPFAKAPALVGDRAGGTPGVTAGAATPDVTPPDSER